MDGLFLLFVKYQRTRGCISLEKAASPMYLGPSRWASLPHHHDSNPAGQRNISALSLHAEMFFLSFQLMTKI
jgi:hypothetical protein